MKKTFAAIAAAAGTLVAAHLALTEIIFFESFDRRAVLQDKAAARKKKKSSSEKKETIDPRLEWFEAQKPEICETTRENGKKLSARFFKGESNVFLIGVHAYRTNAMKDFRFLAKFYHDMGANLLLSDHPGAGDSEGNTISFGFEESKALLKWINYIKERFGEDAQIILHGFSMGASTALILSDNEAILPNVKFIVADCGFTDVSFQLSRTLQRYGKHTGLLMKTLSAESRLRRGFSFDEVRPVDHVKHSLVPILFIHGGRDKVTPVEKGRELFEACSSEKALLVVDDAGHMRSYREEPAEYERKIREFIEKYLQQNEKQETN